VQRQRRAFQKRRVLIDPDRLVVYDESSAKTNLTRRYGRCFDGRRLVEACPHGHWQTTTILSSLRRDGTHAAMALQGAVDAPAFEAYVEQVLLPTLRPGDLFVLDNLAAHKSAKVKTLIESVGAQLWFLPPYSPDLSPIELMWSKVKTILRTCKARTQSGLESAIGQALAAVTARDAAGWFRHCGYVYMQS
jgi:transposase